MPRDNAGNYTLAPGNPVAGGTIISTSWANPTMDDLAVAMTDSLSRTGLGGMLVPFRNADGTALQPGITFALEPSSGLYRAGNTDVRMTIGANDTTRWIDATAQPVGEQRPFEIWNGSSFEPISQRGSGLFPNGDNQNPTIAFEGDFRDVFYWDTTTGFITHSRRATPSVRFTNVTGAAPFNPLEVWDGTSWRELIYENTDFADGTANQPSIAFLSTPNVGIFLDAGIMTATVNSFVATRWIFDGISLPGKRQNFELNNGVSWEKGWAFDENGRINVTGIATTPGDTGELYSNSGVLTVSP